MGWPPLGQKRSVSAGVLPRLPFLPLGTWASIQPATLKAFFACVVSRFRYCPCAMSRRSGVFGSCVPPGNAAVGSPNLRVHRWSSSQPAHRSFLIRVHLDMCFGSFLVRSTFWHLLEMLSNERFSSVGPLVETLSTALSVSTMKLKGEVIDVTQETFQSKSGLRTVHCAVLLDKCSTPINVLLDYELTDDDRVKWEKAGLKGRLIDIGVRGLRQTATGRVRISGVIETPVPVIPEKK